jgi:hypothetical protein
MTKLPNDYVAYDNLTPDVRRRLRAITEVATGDSVVTPRNILEIPVCGFVSTTNITLSGVQTIDGVLSSNYELGLVNGQSDKTENGVYFLSAGTWERWSDMTAGQICVVLDGTVNKHTIWHNKNTTINIGTTDIIYEKVGGVENLADLLDVVLTSITDGQTIVWDADLNKFVNANISGSGDSVGVSLGDKFISGYKHFIDSDESVLVPLEYEYNGFNLAVDGILQVDGVVNLFNENCCDGILDNYYTKAEIDEMIGDIETLLEAL